MDSESKAKRPSAREIIDAEVEGRINAILSNERLPKTKKGIIHYKLSPKQRELVREYDRFKKLQGVKLQTRYCYAVFLRQFGQFIGKPFEECTRRNAEDYLLNVQKTSKTNQFRQACCLKYFYVWLYEKHLNAELPKWVKDIQVKKPRIKHAPGDLLTKEEVKRLIEACETPWHAVMIRLLAESGIRRSELVTLRVGDVSFDSQLATVWANGKSGEGAVFLFDCAPYLMNYLRTHPKRKDPSAPLFFSYVGKGEIKPLGLTTPNKIISRTAKRAGISPTKRVYLHLFRHTAATEDAKVMPDAMMRLKYRWSPYSNMPQHYAAMNSEALKELVMKQNGLKPLEEPKPRATECPVCHYLNEPGERFCTNCYRSITLDAALEVEEKRRVLSALQVAIFKRKKNVSLENLADAFYDLEEKKKRRK